MNGPGASVVGDGPRSAVRTQSARRAHTRAALLEAAARGLSRYGYGHLVLAEVARDAGYTRGALYHQFADKEDLVLAVCGWLMQTWDDEVGRQVDQQSDPLAALLVLARRHAVLCRRDIARVAFALRLEFSGQDHPVGREVEHSYALLLHRCGELITAAQRLGRIPAAPSVEALAQAFVGALEGTVIALAGQPDYDEFYAVRAVAGVLGLPPAKDGR